jgi:glycosyltransferase involved in cell wall biosynthesis
LRIGFFTDTYTPQINGVVTSVLLFADALERLGHEVYIFAPTPYQDSDGDRIVRIPSVPFALQPEMRLASIYSQQAYTLARKAKLDIVHSHDPFSIGLFGLAVARRFEIPYVHTYHTLYPEYVHYVWETKFTRAVAEKLSADWCDQCDLVLAPSTKIQKALVEWGATTRLELLPTGVDAARFATADPLAIATLRRKFAIPATDRLLTFVGRIGKEKNLDLLVEALAQIADPAARLLLVGNGPHRKQLEKHIKLLGVGDRVTFTGYLRGREVAAAYAASDMLFFASLSETQGLVIAEAMASGLPVVAVEDLAIGDAVTDGVNGFLTPESPEALAAAADRVLADPDLRARMGAESRRRAEELSIDKMATRLASLYAEMIATHPEARKMRSKAEAERDARQAARLRERELAKRARLAKQTEQDMQTEQARQARQAKKAIQTERTRRDKQIKQAKKDAWDL